MNKKVVNGDNKLREKDFSNLDFQEFFREEVSMLAEITEYVVEIEKQNTILKNDLAKALHEKADLYERLAIVTRVRYMIPTLIKKILYLLIKGVFFIPRKIMTFMGRFHF